MTDQDVKGQVQKETEWGGLAEQLRYGVLRGYVTPDDALQVWVDRVSSNSNLPLRSVVKTPLLSYWTDKWPRSGLFWWTVFGLLCGALQMMGWL